MTKIVKPLFGDTAKGDIADLITFRTVAGKAAASLKTTKTRRQTAAQREWNKSYTQTHASWMLLPKQEVIIGKRKYQRRIPDWKTYLRQSRPLQAPSGLTATTVSATRIDLAWTIESQWQTGFIIERKAGPGGTWTQVATATASATAYQDTGLAEQTTYRYRVKAVTPLVTSDASSEAQATTLYPAAPTGLTATAISTSRIDLAWTDNSAIEDGFAIERKTGAGGAWTQVATATANTTSYQSTGLTENTTYYYRVRAYKGGTYSSYANEATATTLQQLLPLAPSGLTATTVSATQINLSWTDNSTNETGFTIETKVGNAQNWTVRENVTANTTSYQHTGITAETTIRYRVKAYNANGNSDYSNEAQATTHALPAAPSGLTATTVSASQINLAWTDNSTNETGFKIESRGSIVEDWTLLTTLAAGTTSYQHTGLSAGETRLYRVYAYNNDGNSDYSNEANATTTAGETIPEISMGSSELTSITTEQTSTHRPGCYAVYYTFTLTEQQWVYFQIYAEMQPYLYILSGKGKNGTVVAEKKGSALWLNLTLSTQLDAGDYTIEVTSNNQGQTGQVMIYT